MSTVDSAPADIGPNKTGTALKAHRFKILSVIAEELAGDVVFPTCFDVSIRLRSVLNAPDASLADVANVLAGDPLISSKLLGMANSVGFSPGLGTEVRDLKSAVQRLGLQNVRTIALGLAMKQLTLSSQMSGFEGFAKGLWDHSIRITSACQVIARKMTRLNPDDAFFVGLVHDIGAFYMLYRTSQYDELRRRPESLKHLVVRWHESIGESLLHALGVPEQIVDAVRDHDQPRPLPPTLRKLEDLLHVANRLIGTTADYVLPAVEAPRAATPELGPYLPLLPEIQVHSAELLSAFG
jgi:HD-like signal output (HDOD) protein